MFCATVMVHVDIDGKSNGRIHVALKLANWFSSDLIGISAAILPPYPAESGYFVTLEAIEREHIIATLRKTRGVVEGPHGAAQLLEMNPSTVRFRMKKLSIGKADYLTD